ncbi:MAG: cytochrome c3 family protein [Gammaproteobacteria bacterium]|nr:cytochrome c3 family protein [Gammaproteobacteria bacterium]
MTRRWVTTLLVAGVVGVIPATWAGLSDTKHNLTATGPGPIKEPGVTGELCIFCHAPHNVNPKRGRWNRELPGSVYTLYQSSTLEAILAQPTGASRLCLSCHDGTLALGNLRSPARTGPTTVGRLTGRGVLGTDLSDDHPVSFIYDSTLALTRGELADPSALPPAIRLDGSGQLQCTACHDPHDNPFRKFLRVDDRAAGLCVTCHQNRDWTLTSHANSPATWNGSGINPWPDSPYTTVADNGCQNCHRPHAAPQPPRLLRNAQERGVCLDCHSGSVARHNLEREFSKSSAHPIIASEWTHERREDSATMLRHVACVDCHNPHKVTSAPANAPAVTGRLRGVPGVNSSGGTVSEASFEYEVCFKCHGIRDQTTPLAIVRQDNTRNVRSEIDQGNPSHHPVTALGNNPTMGGFEPGYSTASIIYCTDCHNADGWTLGGTIARGPHGSIYAPILEREYQMDDPTLESFQSYELCYKCHNRSFLINDQARTFLHNKHVVEQQSSCAVCHDAHGSRDNVHLINFMLVDRTGRPAVAPASSGRLEYNALGAGRGECFLMCHGKDHNPEQYP